MRRVWISLSWRALVNVEALNMAESVGNYVKHRRAAIAFFDETTGKYAVKYVPVISGEALGHAYQVWLAEEAANMGLSVCKLCRRGELVKHGARVVLQDEGLPLAEDLKQAEDLEKTLIRNCVVEDVGGFLVPSTTPVKRTSVFYVGYMVPAYDSIKAAVTDPQFHARHAPSLIKREEEFRETGQAIYIVETASAVYTVSAALDVTGIGRTSTFSVVDVVSREEKVKRAKAAIRSIYYLLVGMFGAKRTRFLPGYELLSAVASVSKGAPFNVSPGHSKDYVLDSAIRAQMFEKLTESKTTLFAYVNEPGVEVPAGVIKVGTPEELVKAIMDAALKALEEVLHHAGEGSTP